MFLKNTVISIWLLSLLMCLTGCSFFDPRLINTPIDLHKAGSVVETDFKIAQNDTIELELWFFVNDQPNDYDRLRGFLGRSTVAAPYPPGVTVPLKIKIIKYADSKESVIVDKTYVTTGTFSVAQSQFSRLIDKMRIESGKYRIRLESTKDFPELANTPVQFWLSYFRRK